MTRVVLERRKDGSFVCRAEGHANFQSAGSDIVCAAESILLGTAARMLEQTRGIAVTPLDVRTGVLAFSAEISSNGESDTLGGNESLGRAALERALLAERLTTAGDFLQNGLTFLAREYPEHIEFRETSV